MGRFGAGQAVTRVEDQRFLTGTGRYTDDVTVEGMAHSAVVRSPHAHAEIKAIDTSAALVMPGVVAVLTAADLRADGVKSLPVVACVANADGSRMTPLPRPVLAAERVCHAGEGVALVIAETLLQAKDAAEAVDVTYAELDAVGDIAAARSAGAAEVWPEQAPGNVLFDWAMGDAAATEAAFAGAARVVSMDLVNSRIAPTAMEPRSSIGQFDPDSGQFTLISGTQGSHALQDWMATVLGVPESLIRVITPDVGGGFGMRLFAFPEQALVLAAARRLGRPVKLTLDRAESFLSDSHGRDHLTKAELALDDQGRYLGLRVEIDANIGAYTSQFAAFVATGAGTGMLPGVYDFPCFAAKVRGFVTNTAPVDAYRGAGRPEAAYVIERLTDLAARELGMAPDALRALNMIPPDKMPYKTPGRKTYDSGDFVAVMDHAKDLADWDSYAERAAATAAKGLLRGRGLAYYIEACAGGSPETAEVILDGQGGAEILIGTQSSGQGHETAYAQITADALGLPVSAVRVVQGDTDRIATGGGTGGSRSLPVGGAALDLANDGLIAKASGLAAEMLETAAEDLTFEDGLFRMRSANRTVTLTEVAAEALKRDPTGGGLRASDSYAPPSGTYPNGCHICEVEVDPETGGVRFDRYVIVDDVGVTLNPLLLEGQVVGGAVQGWGQAMVESTVYDPQTGQLVTGSFMDYALPRADDLPAIVHATRNVPCLNNPLGIKGAGEAGTIGATPAAVNAVFDALWDKGVRQLDMPLSPARVYAALAKAGA